MSIRSQANSIRMALLAALLIGFISSICFFLLHAYRITPQAKAKTNPSSSLVGTWISSNRGQVLNLRVDGTGRFRFSKDDSECSYFEWTHEFGQFSFCQYPKKRSLVWYIRRAMLDDAPTSRYDIVSIADEEIRLTSETGELVTLSRFCDANLESTP
jgi:hypothetical protein